MLGTSEILLPTQRDSSVPHEETELMPPVDPFSRESTRKPEAQFEDVNISRIGSLMAILPNPLWAATTVISPYWTLGG